MRKRLKGLINFDVSEDAIAGVLKEANFTGYRYDGALVWIDKTLRMLQDLQFPDVYRGIEALPQIPCMRRDAGSC